MSDEGTSGVVTGSVVTGSVVVGYDGSSHSQAAVDWAAVEAGRRGSDLVLLAAADYPDVPPPMALPPATWWGGEGTEAMLRVGAARAEAAAPEVAVRTEARVGSPSRALVAASADAAVVVVGTRGHGGLVGTLLGSVAFSVSAHAHCPVVVVRGDGTTHAGPDSPVVVGVDGSDASNAAVSFAADTAARAGAPLVVLTTWHAPALGSYEQAYWATVDPGRPPGQAARQAAEQVVTATVDAVRSRHPGLDVEARVETGIPARQLADASTHAGLLVVGARGRGAVASVVLGSVSHAVVHGASCAVAVVRR